MRRSRIATALRRARRRAGRWRMRRHRRLGAVHPLAVPTTYQRPSERDDMGAA